MTAEPVTWVLRPAGLSPAERISDSLRVWGLRGLDATTPVAVRTSHSWEQINGFVTQRADDASSAQCLSYMRPNSVRNGSLVMSAGGPGPDAYGPGDPEGPVDQAVKVQVSRTPEEGSCQSVSQ